MHRQPTARSRTPYGLRRGRPAAFPRNRTVSSITPSKSDRTPREYDPGVLEFNRLRLFDQAQRIRHDASVQWQYSLNPKLGLSGTFSYLRDNYDKNFFGLVRYLQGQGSVDLLYIPGTGHGSGGAYGEHKRFDYFVRHLLGVTPPPWTKKDLRAPTSDRDEQ